MSHVCYSSPEGGDVEPVVDEPVTVEADPVESTSAQENQEEVGVWCVQLCSVHTHRFIKVEF